MLELFEVLLFPGGESSGASIRNLGQENVCVGRNSRHKQNLDISPCYDFMRV